MAESSFADLRTVILGYIDFAASWGQMIRGNAWPPPVIEAIIKTAAKGTSFGCGTKGFTQAIAAPVGRAETRPPA